MTGYGLPLKKCIIHFRYTFDTLWIHFIAYPFDTRHDTKRACAKIVDSQLGTSLARPLTSHSSYTSIMQPFLSSICPYNPSISISPCWETVLPKNLNRDVHSSAYASRPMRFLFYQLYLCSPLPFSTYYVTYLHHLNYQEAPFEALPNSEVSPIITSRQFATTSTFQPWTTPKQ
jgi:hypothetical protein